MIGVNFFKTEVKIEILKEETFQMFNSVTFQLHFENKGFIESQLNSQCLIRDEQFLPVRADFIFETFPFSLSFDSSMRIECLGQSLHLVIPDAKGKLLGECFQLHRPLVKFTYETILARRNNIFELISEVPAGLRKNSSSRESRLTNGAVMPFSREVLQAKGQRPIHLKGQMLYLAEWDRIIYLASPLMTNLDALTDSGLYINDLSMHDFSRDVMMAGTQKSVELKLLLDQETIKSQKLQESMKKLDDEMKRTDELLYQMIPQSVADRLRHGASPMETCKSFDIVTILFSDVVQFTEISSRITPMEVVCLLNSMYSVYDQLTEIHQVYKVETIGDAYMIVGGVPEACHDHAERVCNMALGMIEGIRDVTEPSTGDPIQIRIGIHSGPVVAGVVGLKMPRYCLFGDTVNTASRMESNSRPMCIHISPRTRALLDSSYRIKDRGETQIKGKGIMKTYWLEGKEGLALRRVTSTGQFSDSQRGYTPVSAEDVAKRRPSDERRINGNYERIRDS